MARRAGMKQASRATNASKAATPAKVSGSVALMPKSRLAKRRVIARAAAIPSALSGLDSRFAHRRGDWCR